MVGPHDPRWEPQRFSALTARSVVHYVGRVSEDEVPAYISATDIGITPYLDSPFNRASFPLKTLDYLSAGRPAVSTALPTAEWLRDDMLRVDQGTTADGILTLASGRDAFINALRHVVGDPGTANTNASDLTGTESMRAERCRAFAARHSWARRADALAAAIGLTA
jgi:teichuronic acid biosynthesis glycosyltransferase TuaH